MSCDERSHKKSTCFVGAQVGFTLIELLVAAAIMMLITGIGVFSFNDFRERQQLEQGARSFAAEVRLAQRKADSGERVGCSELAGYRITYWSLSSYRVLEKCTDGSVGEALGKQLPNGLVFFPIDPKNPDPAFPLFQFNTVTGSVVNAPTAVIIKQGDSCVRVSIAITGDVSVLEPYACS